MCPRAHPYELRLLGLWQPHGGWRPGDGEAPYFSGFPGQAAVADLDPDFEVAQAVCEQTKNAYHIL